MVQLALNVADLNEAVDFYSRLFGTQPAKVRPGYANFAIVEPPLKLVLIENPDRQPGSINHLGVEFETTDEVVAARERLAAAGLSTSLEDDVTCCYAVQNKVWAGRPGWEPWEFYTVVADAEQPDELRHGTSGAVCCASRTDGAADRTTPCC
jgi:catechol 2,3-dioxygenase-like lactoylglutathione lyase family enzyme